MAFAEAGIDKKLPAGGGRGTAMSISFHPLAEIFPLIEGREFDDLAADIKANGLHEPIVLYADKILDGRNRYSACLRVGIEPHFTRYMGNDPVAYVISLNLKRRHLDESQRMMVAAKLTTLTKGGDRRSDQSANLRFETSHAKAAELLHVSERGVDMAKKVQREAVPELQRAVEQGRLSVSAAADIATQPKERQRETAGRPLMASRERARTRRPHRPYAFTATVHIPPAERYAEGARRGNNPMRGRVAASDRQAPRT